MAKAVGEWSVVGAIDVRRRWSFDGRQPFCKVRGVEAVRRSRRIEDA
jgi:hypothetical protein